jgi:hypothetical protein
VGAATGTAKSAPQLAVQMDQFMAPGTLVQVVDVLRNEQELAGPAPLELGERQMGSIGRAIAGSRSRQRRSL